MIKLIATDMDGTFLDSSKITKFNMDFMMYLKKFKKRE